MTRDRLDWIPLTALLGLLLATTPGQAQPLTAKLSFTAVQPCRIVDTRLQAAGALLPDIPRTFHVVGSTSDFAAQGGQAGGCGIPGYQTGVPQVGAVMLNVVAVGPAGAGDLRAWPSDQAVPNASIVNYDALGLLNIANGIALPVSQDAVEGDDLTVRADIAGTHLVIDVLGYFSAASVPTSRVLHLSAVSFVAATSDLDQLRVELFGLLNAKSGKFFANVPLQGGTVTQLTLCAHDNDALDVTARLIAKPLDSFTNKTVMAQVTTTGFDMVPRCFSTTTITAPQIQPTLFAYFVELEFPNNNNVDVAGVQVTYIP